MNKYCVLVHHCYEATYIIEAESEEEAIEVVNSGNHPKPVRKIPYKRFGDISEIPSKETIKKWAQETTVQKSTHDTYNKFTLNS